LVFNKVNPWFDTQALLGQRWNGYLVENFGVQMNIRTSVDGFYPERACSYCGRFVVVGNDNLTIIHIIGPVYNPWSKQNQNSVYEWNDKDQDGITQTTQEITNGSVKCETMRQFYSETYFEDTLEHDTMFVHVSNVDLMHGFPLVARSVGGCVEMIVPDADSSDILLLNNIILVDDRFVLVGVDDEHALLTRAVSQLLRSIIPTSPFHSSNFFPTYLFQKWLVYSGYVPPYSTWKVVSCMDVDQMWEEMSKCELVNPALLDGDYDPATAESLSNCYRVIWLLARAIKEQEIISEALLLPSASVATSFLRSQDKIALIFRVNCDYLECPFCGPLLEDFKDETALMLGAGAQQFCSRSGTQLAD